MPTTVTLTIPDQLCIDLLSTAYEGGSNYWLHAKRFDCNEKKEIVRLYELTDAETGETFDEGDEITLETMRLGIARLCDVEFFVAARIRASLFEALTDPESSAWDAETADCVVQAGLFGSIVYG